LWLFKGKEWEQKCSFSCINSITTNKKQMEEFLEGLRTFKCPPPDPSELLSSPDIHFTKEQQYWGGKVVGKENYEKKRGIWSQTEEQWKETRFKGGKVAGKKLYDVGKGLFGMNDEDKKKSQVKGGIKQGNNNKKLGKGICGLTKEQRSENTKKQMKQKWKCLVTGHISTYNSLSRFQNNRGIDKTMREMVL